MLLTLWWNHGFDDRLVIMNATNIVNPMDKHVKKKVAEIRRLESIEQRTFDSLLADFYAHNVYESRPAPYTVKQEPWWKSNLDSLRRFLPKQWSEIFGDDHSYKLTSLDNQMIAYAVLNELGVFEVAVKEYKHLYPNSIYAMSTMVHVLETKQHLFENAAYLRAHGNWGALHETNDILVKKFGEHEGLINLPPLQLPTDDEVSKIAHAAMLQLIEKSPLIFMRHVNAGLAGDGYAKAMERADIMQEAKRILQ